MAQGRSKNGKAIKKPAVDRLKDAQAQLLYSEKMATIGQLAAGVAHEINNPVGFILSNLGMLDRYAVTLQELIKRYQGLEAQIGKTSPKEMEACKASIAAYAKSSRLEWILSDIRPAIEETRDGAERIKRIVNDLRTFSHPGENDLVKEDVHRIIEIAINIARSELKSKADIVKKFADIPPILCCPQLLSQVFLNLLVNAAQSIDGYGVITITSAVHGSRVSIEFSDTGCGISQEALKHVFEPFYTTKPVGQGTGLGLSIAYGIILKHRGTITVNSSPGEGTTFTIQLPVATSIV